MYITRNLYDKYAEYIDIPDMKFFHHLIEIAKERYYKFSDELIDMSDEEIKRLKNEKMIVLFASTVSNYSAQDDVLIARPEMNERARRKYMIIDADFDAGQEVESEKMMNDLKQLSIDYNTPLIIYPTVSYPAKPRFRAVLFSKNALNEGSYYQAMSWLYTMLGRDPLDPADLKIRSNNNAPFFINEDQVNAVFDNTMEDGLEPLDNVLWKTYSKPKIAKAKAMKKSQFDEFKIPSDVLEEACREFAASPAAKHFNSFWFVLHSIARAEFFGQIDSEQVNQALTWIAQVPGDQLNSAKWSIENKNQYKNERRRVFENEKILYNARPLTKIPEFGNVFLKRDIIDFK